jgi:hypothetical protein
MSWMFRGISKIQFIFFDLYSIYKTHEAARDRDRFF